MSAEARQACRDFEPTPGFWGGDRVTEADLGGALLLPARGETCPALSATRRGSLRDDNSVERLGGSTGEFANGWSVWFKGGLAARPGQGGTHKRGRNAPRAGLSFHRGGERAFRPLLCSPMSRRADVSGFGRDRG